MACVDAQLSWEAQEQGVGAAQSRLAGRAVAHGMCGRSTRLGGAGRRSGSEPTCRESIEDARWAAQDKAVWSARQSTSH
jgi:hypothetical protein